MKRVAAGVAACVFLLASGARAGEVGFPEDFALAKDRSVPLKQLIPGTEEYYHYQCIHAQNTGKLADVDAMLPLWIKRHGRTDRVTEIENRQALLKYEKEAAASLEFIRQRLGIQFNHQREILGQKPQLPTALDANLIGRPALTQAAFAKHPNSIDGFEDSSLEWLIATALHPDLRRQVIQRLQRPDLANLPKIVVDDVNHEHSGGFGSLPIHRHLLLAQLEECLKLKPDLLNQQNFVNAYLPKLWPGPDADWERDPKEREAYLDRLWAFASRLNPANNSLIAHVLYNRLVHDRAKGVYDKDRFMAYLKLPRPTGYVNQKYMELDESRRFPVNLGADYRNVTLLPAIGNDEPLVRSYLAQYFTTENAITPYDTYINDIYLKELFAETKIVNGLGDMEQWYAMLPPERYQALKERVDIDFAFTNKTMFAPAEAVGFDLFVKNVKTLIVKVFEINAFNYYRDNGREVDTAVNLDGLVANEEKTYTYEEPALRRVKRHFDFPALNTRGVYVVEFIGNGMSSRALVQKGRLRFLVRTSTAGQIFTVFDETNKKLTDAALWLAGQKYSADKEGVIAVPFSNAPGRQPIILTQGAFATLDTFEHRAENYQFTAGIYVDREALLKRTTAGVIVRPSLMLNGTPISLSILEEPTLVITSTDRDGVNTTKEVPAFKLFEDRESTYEFAVPENLASIQFTLKAKVQNLSQNKKVDLAASRSFRLNAIDQSDKIEQLLLSRVGGQWVLDVLGKTGEPKADRPVQFVLKHKDFRDVANASLQTDVKGRIALGALADIQWVQAQGPEGVASMFPLTKDARSYPDSVHGRAGEPVLIPYLGSAAQPQRAELSLLERRGDTFVEDRFAALSLKNGFVQVQDLPQGDYDLLLKDVNERITVRLTQGAVGEGYVLGDNRHLEVVNAKPLQIASVSADAESVKVTIENASKFARVHVFATRYLPEYEAYSQLGVAFAEPSRVTQGKAESLYVTGRDIGDEFRYILERKLAKKYPGNLLARPSLLLNPWAIRATETELQEAQAGGEHLRRFGGAGRGAAYGGRAAKAAAAEAALGPDLDFLAAPSAVLANLRADKNGVVTIKRADLGPHHQIHIVAVDPLNTVYRELSLPEAPMKFLDLRLADALDPKKHFTEQKQITVVPQGGQFTVGDLTTSDFQPYDTLAKVYTLYVTLSGNSDLVEFGFLANWPKLKPEEKREKYSKYACHELSFFLSRKDPEFFKTVILPYLANKRDKTFMDHWLLGDDLSSYLKPWAFGQLNAVERILLAQRLAGEAPHTGRHVKDLYDLIPPDVERFNHLFKTALRGRALETSDDLGVGKAKEQAKALKEAAGEKLAELEQAEKAPAPANGALAITAGIAAARPAAPPPAPAEPGKPAADMPAETPAAAKDLSFRAEAKKREAGKLDDAVEEADADKSVAYFAADEGRRKSVRQLFRKLEQTKEWVENNYYHLPIENQNAGLVTVNAFWNDYASHDGKTPFFSRNLAEASRSFTEMMLALAVLDLPFEAGAHKPQAEGARFTLAAASPMVVFHKEIKEAPLADEKTPILISQNFFRHGDRYRMEGNERFDKYVADEFLISVVYGCNVVITNPTSSPQKLDVLLQIPRGALPVNNGQATRSFHLDLQPFHTQTAEFYFYFPGPGDFPHYPVHIAKLEKLIAFAPAVTLHVVEKPTKVDTTSWDYISQNGTEDEVFAYLKANNLDRTNLDRIAWRTQDKAFFGRLVPVLVQRHVYNHTLWSYGIKHDDPAAVREFLQHCDDFLARCGAWLDCKLVTIDPVVRKSYQHMEYWPLVNARAHRLGRTRKILNDRFYAQYMGLLNVLTYRPALDDNDLMSVTYYMLLQDRIEDGLDSFGRVDAKKLATKLQHDYFAAYLDFYTDAPKAARAIAAKYADHPVDRWRNVFANVVAQLDEIEGKGAKVVDKEDHAQQQAALAATEGSFDFKVEARKITLNYQNLSECVVRYYLMDIELLFSRNPFVQAQTGQFAYIRPNEVATVKLDPAKAAFAFDLPAKFHNSNVMVEIVAGGITKSQAYYANALALQVIEPYGQVKVTSEQGGKPLAKVYVKVYARMKDGQVKFFKDGYTDLRGRFDYASLSTNEIDNVDRYSLLVLSETDGAVVREAAPPKR